MKKIPILYQYILNRIDSLAYNKEIDVKKVRDIISRRFRIRREIVFKMLCELKDMGAIEYINLRKIKIKWK